VKLALLASPSDGEALHDILKALDSAKVSAYGLKIREGWKSLSHSLIADYLEKADHYLLVASPEALASSWLSFAVGFCLGRRSNLVLYSSGDVPELPTFLEGLPVLSGIEELVAYYQFEKSDWAVLEESRAARASLLEMGISCHADSLGACVSEGDTRAVDLFLKTGFHPDSRDRRGVTLLCLAARGRHLSIAQQLLDAGAYIDLQSEDRGYSALMDATRAGAVDLVRYLLSKGADPNLRSKDGQTALIVAVGRNDAETARLLLDYGADPSIPDKLGIDAAKYASLFKNPEVMELF
jgi:hypothetical protein